ncbi:MAG: aldehyde dehydrogenase family protein [Methylomonas sp.]|nr:aldehyde dehydrogenase family protein [Methylomonas sp.]PPD19883.1 MAG: aldehyde dehydrogenase [Methylomonas sp.]PPD24830.1 MAG: aldehyde dehydrogenase [Methylomonas sp.]PPD33618.1 MAG: aldehyde dehydrogenase [Methylomonas sp.]PPD39391.1 MAG: aldehyde dehydrogenase [Methylomonas sp.]
MTSITLVSPCDGRHLGEYPLSSAAEITACVATARHAAEAWAGVTVQRRVDLLSALADRLLTQVDSLVECISQTTGKVPTEALLGEIYPVLDALTYYRKHATEVLADRHVATSPFGFPGASAYISRKPFGVVAVLSPSNAPFQLAMLPMLTALLAGNAVILKASELGLPVARRILELFATLDLPPSLVQSISGGREAGESLIDAAPDLVFFTGSLQAGRAVMQRAAQHPLPVILELGGKDAMIVFDDANLQRATDAALYGAFCHAGQLCVSVERLLVQRTVHDALLQRLLAGVSALHVGPHGDIGAMTNTRQIDLIRAHYDDALAHGAQASAALRIEGRWVWPVVLWNVHAGMRVMREESFGPLLPVLAFDDEAEALRLANDTEFGLNASVWSQNIARAERFANRLQVGNWAVNDVIKNIGHPALPFGGVKRSGFGRYHGAEGLLSFSQPVSGMICRSSLPSEPNWFPYSPERYAVFKHYLDFMHGKGTVLQRIQRNWPALQTFRRYSAYVPGQYWRNFKRMLSWKRNHS